MKKILFLLLFGVNSAFAENNYGFTYQNEPVNPACIAMFNSSLADHPYIRSINLNVCQHSNAASNETLKAGKGSYYYYLDGKDDEKGHYSYKVIGKTKNNIYVIHTTSSGGGSGVFNDLLLIRLDKGNQYVYERISTPRIDKIVELKLLGYVVGGDRCVGDFKNVQIVNNQLIIKQYDGDNPSDCDKTKSYIIDLSNII